MSPLAESIWHLCELPSLGLVLLGTSLGIIVGAIPGLTGAMLIALTLPLTYNMAANDALILLVSMYVGSISGGLITATLLRMPGTPASVMTTLDGYPLAQSGQPGRALGLGITASLVGGLISWGFLVLLSSPMAKAAAHMTKFEFFSLVVMALVLIAAVSGRSLMRGALAGVLGMLATMPGQSRADAQLRCTFGIEALNGGLKLLPVLIGLFAVSQVLSDIVHIGRRGEQLSMSRRGMFMSWKDWRAQGVNMTRSSLIGTWIGILPGIGANIGSVLAYTAAKFFSRTPKEFGHGSEEGIVASEAGNNATVGGALIPLISMGIPGSVIDAILLGALVVHNLQPGPLLFRESPGTVYTIMGATLLANLCMFAFMAAAIGWLARLSQVPRYLLLPVVLVFCVVGAFALDNRIFDVGVMLAFGLIGFGMERLGIPLAPFVIGFVLAPVAEEHLSAGLQLSDGSYWPLLTERLSPVFLAIAAVMLAWPLIAAARRESTLES